MGMIQSFIETQRAGKIDFNVCIRAAFTRYCSDFITAIRDLVHTCEQVEKSSGKPFWTGTKRRPVEGMWDPTCPPVEALEYLYAFANCYAFMWGVSYVRDRAIFQDLVVSLRLEVPEWKAP